MEILVIKFPREGYKVRWIFCRNHLRENIEFCKPKIGDRFRKIKCFQKLKLSHNVNIKKDVPKFISLSQNHFQNDSIALDIQKKSGKTIYHYFFQCDITRWDLLGTLLLLYK